MKHVDPTQFISTTPTPTGLNPAGYMRSLHPTASRGKPSLCARRPDGTFFSKCKLPDEAVHQSDHWLESEAFATLNRFHGPRRTERLAERNALFLDLDTYRVPRFRGFPPLTLLHVFELQWKRIGLPSPSFLIDSGRGHYPETGTEVVRRSRRSETVQPDHVGFTGDIASPAEFPGGLDGDPRRGASVSIL